MSGSAIVGRVSRSPISFAKGAVWDYNGFQECIPKMHRYRVTEYGSRAPLFFKRTFNRILRPGLA
jgi:hypothetical protein